MARPKILDQVAAAGHVVFETGDLNLNIIGTRSSVRRADVFDDLIHVVYKRNGEWVWEQWPATTDPGITYLTAPMRKSGCAILVPGQYRGSHVMGKHKGRYNALVQDRPMKFVRDNNLNTILDIETALRNGASVETAVIGCNVHAADSDPFDKVDPKRVNVGPWSAACQVFQRSEDYRRFWSLIKEAAAKYGPRFTYTLLDTAD